MSKGKRIKDLREAQYLSQVDLAIKVGVSKQTLYKYENDIITNIPSDKIEAIAKELHSSPAYILGWSDLNTDIYASERILTEDESKLLDKYQKLNADGKQQAQDYMDFLSSKYQKDGGSSGKKAV